MQQLLVFPPTEEEQVFNAVRSRIRHTNDFDECLHNFRSSYHKIYLPILVEWFRFYIKNHHKHHKMYNILVSLFFQMAQSNELFQNQSVFQRATSMNFIKALFCKDLRILANYRETRFLLVTALVYGSYHEKLYRGFKMDMIPQWQQASDLFIYFFREWRDVKPLTHDIGYLNRHEIEIQIDLWRGKSLRHEKNLPLPVSRKEANLIIREIGMELHFDNHVLLRSIIAAKMLKEGGNLTILEMVLEASPSFKWNLNSFKENLTWWIGVYRLIFKSEEQHMLFDVREYVDYFEFKLADKEHPYSLKGRTTRSIGISVRRWHTLHEYGDSEDFLNKSWKGLGIENANYEYQNKSYSISEIKNGQELYDEGKELEHCVFTYVRNCYKGRTAIFSLKLKIKTTYFRRITFEVEGNSITQIKGKNNRCSTDTENSVIAKWARQKHVHLRSQKEHVEICTYGGEW